MGDAQGEARDAQGEARDAQGEARDAQGEERDAQGEAGDAQGEPPVKRWRRVESSATTNIGMDDKNLEDRNHEITGFVKHSESMSSIRDALVSGLRG